MARSNAYPTANVGAYSESINEQGELVISGNYKGDQISQTVPCHPPCILFLDTVNKNFYAIENIHDADPAWEFVKLIKGIA